MAKFRKKPVIVEAIQWWQNGDHPGDRVGEVLLDAIGGGNYDRQEGAVVRYFRHPDYPGDQLHNLQCGRSWHEHGWIDTDGGGHTVCPGDWIVTSVCKPDVFKALYELTPAD